MKWNELPFLIKLILTALFVLLVLFAMHVVSPEAASTAVQSLKHFMEAIFPFMPSE